MINWPLYLYCVQFCMRFCIFNNCNVPYEKKPPLCCSWYKLHSNAVSTDVVVVVVAVVVIIVVAVAVTTVVAV